MMTSSRRSHHERVNVDVPGQSEYERLVCATSSLSETPRNMLLLKYQSFLGISEPRMKTPSSTLPFNRILPDPGLLVAPA